MHTDDDAGAFWNFAVSAYAREGVAAECLALQDRYGAAVMLLLFLCWRATQQVVLDAAELRAAGLRIEAHERHLGAPLRASRRVWAAAARARGDWHWLQPGLARLRAESLAVERLQASALAAAALTPTVPGDPESLGAGMIGRYLAALDPAPAPEAARRLAARVLAPAPYPSG